MKRKVQLAGVIGIVAIITASFLLFVIYSTSGATVSPCIPNGSLMSQATANKNNLLSGFAVSCIKIVGSQGAPLMDGVTYFATGQQQLEQGFQNVTSFGDCNGYASPANSCIGMIFVLPAPRQLCFWMHNTILPLRQSWISANGTVSAVFNASPETDFTVCHTGEYVLESNISSPISVGDRVLLNET